MYVCPCAAADCCQELANLAAQLVYLKEQAGELAPKLDLYI
jgi:hypothetical protein